MGAPPQLQLGGQYRLGKNIGSGSFGEVYTGTHLPSNTEVAIKLESCRAKYPQLEHEARVYRKLLGERPSLSSPSSHSRSSSSSSSSSTQSSPPRPPRTRVPGVAHVWFFGTEGDWNVLVVELLGPSLEDLFAYCGQSFGVKTVLMLADQLLTRLEFLHSHSVLHRDIKPDNFLMGLGPHGHEVSVSDFGLSKAFRDSKTGVHIPWRDGRSLTGTTRYSSVRTHLGEEQSRRDDLESLSYLLIYLLLGRLPWQSLPTPPTSPASAKHARILALKQSTPIATFTAGLPPEFGNLVRYARGLAFEDRPDYEGLRKGFRGCFERGGWGWDWVWEWSGGGVAQVKAKRREEREEEEGKTMVVETGSTGPGRRKVGAEKRPPLPLPLPCAVAGTPGTTGFPQHKHGSRIRKTDSTGNERQRGLASRVLLPTIAAAYR